MLGGFLEEQNCLQTAQFVFYNLHTKCIKISFQHKHVDIDVFDLDDVNVNDSRMCSLVPREWTRAKIFAPRPNYSTHVTSYQPQLTLSVVICKTFVDFVNLKMFKSRLLILEIWCLCLRLCLCICLCLCLCPPHPRKVAEHVMATSGFNS